MNAMVCFISDFGLDDAWVGVCHAVMMRVCPRLAVVDLSHQIPPFDVRKGAAVAAVGVLQVPDAVHLVVVDPGVGGGRRNLALECANGSILVGPDNGILIPAALRCGGIRAAWALEGAAVGVESPLSTFHARDVLAPAAAALACGEGAHTLGTSIDPEGLAAPPFGPPVQEGEALLSEIIDVDHFGSARTSVTERDLEALGEPAGSFELSFGHVALEVPLASTFSDVDVSEPLALLDSSGWLTIAVRLGSAAERYGLHAGVTVRIRKLG